MKILDLIAAYEYGIDYGLILAENERDSEDVFDAAGCSVFSAKMCVASVSPRRRMPHSDAWRESKRKSMDKFLELVVKAANEEATHGKD